MANKHQYRVSYQRGLGEPLIVEAEDASMARKMALAEYRRKVTMVDFTPMDSIVKKEVEDLGPIV